MQTRIGTPAEPPAPPFKTTRRPHWFEGREETWLGKAVGVTQFGVNRVVLQPGAYTSLRHWHLQEDEFVYVLSGQAVLIDDNGEHVLGEGDYAGFPAGAANAHHLTNRGAAPAILLVVGARHRGAETLTYPDEEGFGPFTVVRDARGDRISNEA